LDEPMPVRRILKMGEPSLFEASKPVEQFDSPVLHGLVRDLQDTMKAANGAGIAAPQIGINWRVVIFGGTGPNPRYPDAPPIPYTVLINPTITPLTDELESGWEGCLSVPGMRGVVARPRRVRYQGYGLAGESIDRTVEGFHARVVQHECDHLDGILYPMRVRDFREFGYTDVLFPDLADRADDD
jgi:peptide deformylase